MTSSDDNELFELCKSVYEATEWHDTDSYLYDKGNGKVAAQFKNNLETKPGYWWYEGIDAWPLYTSDYLLEKLPRKVYEGDNWIAVHDVLGFDDLPLWTAEYTDGDEKAANGKFDTRLLDLVGRDETPLKALLKVTLELHKKGLLDAKDN